MKHKEKGHDKEAKDKDLLSRQDLIAGASAFSFSGQPHPAPETPQGKNNGAEPAVYQNQRKAQT